MAVILWAALGIFVVVLVVELVGAWVISTGWFDFPQQQPGRDDDRRVH